MSEIKAQVIAIIVDKLNVEEEETLETLETKIHELELHYFPIVLEEVLKKITK